MATLTITNTRSARRMSLRIIVRQYTTGKVKEFTRSDRSSTRSASVYSHAPMNVTTGWLNMELV